MLVLNDADIRKHVSLGVLIERLETAFLGDALVPERRSFSVPGGADRVLVAMPAFRADGSGVVKLFTAFPDNCHAGIPYIQASVVVFSDTGTPQAVLDGVAITRLRTGAASALASKFLSRDDSSNLVMIGDGAIIPTMVAAHCTVRPIRNVTICGIDQERISKTISAVRELGRSMQVNAGNSVEDAVRGADIVSCATSSATPVLQGKWLRDGTHVDLIGSFSPSRRESDDEVMLRSHIYVDTLEGALSEAGDIIDPIRRGIIGETHIEGDLADLVSGRKAGRKTAAETTLFKSVGTALEDLVAAQLALDQCDTARSTRVMS